MRTYVVRAGDSPASIAAQDHHAACPKCSVDLIRANPEKKTVRYPNGFVTFKDLRVGEVLRLPEKWFDGTLDRMPREYFASLPYANGVTPGVGQTPTPQPLQVEKKGLSTGAVLGIGLAAAVTVDAITYAVTRPKRKRRQ